jgi:hypothetical protein
VAKTLTTTFALPSTTPLITLASCNTSAYGFRGTMHPPAKGAKIRHPPLNFPWALEMKVEDLHGHVLRFGSEPKPDRPFAAWRE